MQQHPVPQNITKFQFKLIGEMTIRQFLYLAFSGILSIIVFASPWPVFLKLPLIAVFAIFGLAFAFIPIQERPLEIWIVNFIKSVLSPTQYLWQKNPELPDIFNSSLKPSVSLAPEPAVSQENNQYRQLQNYISQIQPGSSDRLDKLEQNYISQIDSFFGQSTPSTVFPRPRPQSTLPKGIRTRQLRKPLPGQPLPTIILPPKPASFTLPSKPPVPVSPVSSSPSPPVLTDKVEKLQEELEKEKGKTILTIQELKKIRQETQAQQEQANKNAQIQLTSTRDRNEQLKKDIVELSSQINQLRNISSQTETEKQENARQVQKLKETLALAQSEKDQALQRISFLQQKLTAAKIASVQPAPLPPSQQEISPPKAAISFLSNIKASKLGLSNLCNKPNAFCGIVTDPKNNLLQDAVLLVKDEANTPVRALKTNKLGQFVVSTPLESGTYTINTELDNYQFEPGQITLQGKIIPPVQIRAQYPKKGEV